MFPTFSDPREVRIARFGFTPELADKILRAKRCFILGTAPSIAKINFQALQDELVIGVNFIMKSGCRPDILCISDPNRVDPALDITSPPVITVRHVRRDNVKILDRVNVYSDIDFVPLTQATVMSIEAYPPALDKIYCGGTVIGDLCLPLVSYLGIPTAYILGMDGFAATFPRSHAWGNEVDSRIDAGWLQGTARLNQKAVALAKLAGCKVMNATTGGMVSVIPRVDVTTLSPDILRRTPAVPIDGRYIVFRGRVLRAEASPTDPQTTRLQDIETGHFLRHSSGLIYLHPQAENDLFLRDSSFFAEPGFVDASWISLRSFNIEQSYVTADNERNSYRLRRLDKMFSPYFSSFRVFDTPQQAQSRVRTDLRLQELETTRREIGAQMLIDDSTVLSDMTKTTAE